MYTRIYTPGRAYREGIPGYLPTMGGHIGRVYQAPYPPWEAY